MENQLGIGFTGAPYGVREISKYAEMAEQHGLTSFWCAEDYFLRDAITNISCAAFVTKKIRISTGVVNPYTRNPVLIAETVATLNELAQGRIRLALGTGVQPLVESMGIEFKHPIKGIAESVELIRRLLRGEKVDYAGEIFSAKGVKIGENPYFALIKSNLNVSPVPIYIAAIGPKMLELSGRIADGALFTAGFSVFNVKEAIPKVTEGARRAGRKISDVSIGTYIVSSLGEASAAIRGFLAFDVAYARPENVIAAGVSETTVNAIRDALEKRGIQAASELVNREIVDGFAACGTKGEIQSKVEEFRAAGVTEPILLPMGTDAGELIRGVS